LVEEARHDGVTAVQGRVRVDGKFLSRDGQRLRVQGVTYGPFAPDADGQQFPAPEVVAEDFALMRAAGINSLRTYHLPPEWFLNLADEQGMTVFIDVPWSKHLCFLDSGRARAEARQSVARAAKAGSSHPCLLAYSIGNEVPPDIVRWHGARRVERFLGELRDVAKQADPDGLVTYASFPPTEYLDLSFLDFVTFNVYLHDPEAFRRYLFRLQNLVGDKPLLLGEIGMDTLRHGEVGQADFLANHVREVVLMGLVGSFVFSWTDDWFTGGHRIEDWAFGLTTRDRTPKVAYHALAEVFKASPAALLPSAPRVSVVVCTYNGGRTLEQCLTSLAAVDYPDYEVLVVNDGSTDNTAELLGRFPNVRAIHQANRGLSVARNVGLRAATGSVIAYTDDDCFVDPDWLAQLVYQLERSGAAAVGGPNLSPEDGRVAACVAASPGQPMHVLESEQVAEHIPGCNMAFRRAALEAIKGFDPQFKKAGDDVDLCWRLQQAGMWITFAPGAFVWHHRRQTPRTYFRQQAGYGEAEALLRFKHPDKFNGRGDGKWRGMMYGDSLCGLRFSDGIIYRGTFGTGLFQCIYRPGTAHWAMFPSTLEWHAGAAVVALTALFFWPLWLVVLGMLGLSLTVAALQAAQARLAPEHDGLRSRLLIMGLCYAQPLVRSWRRYVTRVLSHCPSMAPPGIPKPRGKRLPLSGTYTASYWSEQGYDRTELLGLIIAYLTEHKWGKRIDEGWSDWDLEIFCHPWTVVQLSTAQEEHGGGRRLIRTRYRLRTEGYTKVLGALIGLTAVIGFGLLSASAGLEKTFFFSICGLLGLAWGWLWWHGTYRAALAVGMVDSLARDLGLIPLQEAPVALATRGGPSPEPGATSPPVAPPLSGEAVSAEEVAGPSPLAVEPSDAATGAGEERVRS
jgi:GT2 family glycosyltransferase